MPGQGLRQDEEAVDGVGQDQDRRDPERQLKIDLLQHAADRGAGEEADMLLAEELTLRENSRIKTALHLAEISATVSRGAIALLIFDGAGWHVSPRLVVPDNIVLLPLPPYAPELNPTETVWEYLRANWLSNSVWDTYDDPHRLLRCLERPGRKARCHPVNRNQTLGEGQQNLPFGF